MNELDRYPGQPDDEITQHVFFKSVFAILPFIVAGVILSLVSLFMIFYGASHPDFVPSVPIGLAVIGIVILLLVVLMMWGVIWVWRRNRVVVTNERLVDISQNGLFSKKVSTLSLAKIQDVSAKVNGPWQTLFQFGTVIVQTAGERENFVLDFLPAPYQTEQYILEVHRQFAQQAGGTESADSSGSSAKDEV